jgi:hypothetical protein
VLDDATPMAPNRRMTEPLGATTQSDGTSSYALIVTGVVEIGQLDARQLVPAQPTSFANTWPGAGRMCGTHAHYCGGHHGRALTANAQAQGPTDPRQAAAGAEGSRSLIDPRTRSRKLKQYRRALLQFLQAKPVVLEGAGSQRQ